MCVLSFVGVNVGVQVVFRLFVYNGQKQTKNLLFDFLYALCIYLVWFLFTLSTFLSLSLSLTRSLSKPIGDVNGLLLILIPDS